jgi:hypothetical protein
MEINSLSAYQYSKAEIMTGESAPPFRKSISQEENQQTVGEDRVDVLRGQNAAAVQTESLDVESALQLLGNIEGGMPNLTSNDLSQFYNYDHLRQVFSR